ncbi:MAG: alanine--tRNA ligase-related protein, partial [Nanoarchaeota archaeon]
MILNFNAKVLDLLTVNNRKFVILDRSAFYPTGGGQEHDTGYLIKENNEEERIRVFNVVKYKNTILHEVEDFK